MKYVLGFFQTDLPEYYRIWMEIAHNIPQLIKTHQLRNVVQKVRLVFNFNL